MNDNFDEPKRKTLFCSLSRTSTQTLSQKEINICCEKIILSFNELYFDLKVKELLNKTCKKNYKISIDVLFEDLKINLQEMPQHQDEPFIWHDFIISTYVLINNIKDELDELNKKIADIFLFQCLSLNSTLKLKLESLDKNLF